MHAHSAINVFDVLAHRSLPDSKTSSDLFVRETRTGQEIRNLALSYRQLRQQWVMSFSHVRLLLANLVVSQVESYGHRRVDPTFQHRTGRRKTSPYDSGRMHAGLHRVCNTPICVYKCVVVVGVKYNLVRCVKRIHVYINIKKHVKAR